jgi:UDP-glucose 4-epimerase
MRKRILIIGGDSFIAGQFIHTFPGLFNFVIVSRRSTGFKNEYITEDFFELPITLFQHVDAVINFAAIVHRPGLENEQLYENINFRLPVHLANQSIEGGIEHFIQISTVAVYGNSTYIDESTRCKPIDHYGKYKLMADEALTKLAAGKQIRITIVRPSMIYGEKNAPGNMQRLIQLVQKGWPLPFLDVKNSRQFLHISNFNHVLRYILQNKYYGLVLVADPEPVSTSELIKIISETLQKKNRQFYLPFLWKIISYFKKNFAGKLIDNLIIKISIPYEKVMEDTPWDIRKGIVKMIN